jgi:hypothetical protein
MHKTLSLAAALMLAASPLLADHANPWATDGDTTLSRFHDSNQARSADTPGEDEMRGVMVRSARGKLDTAASATGTGRGKAGGGSPGAGGPSR